ncbi:Down syndrome cell adhesion molecule-like protein Dscam2 [Centruroides sculpturatus]|uniref:Down syndrome cell adhesion molecule-like protein Dscam2 n=1 Tax=Centruroides sculpturatus TaxID=218467 RepID=UPI000C6CC697|nr:Down syndrome cell adhesion molecule-like protein Dscam2 [Centruroides sculpturatus]
MKIFSRILLFLKMCFIVLTTNMILEIILMFTFANASQDILKIQPFNFPSPSALNERVSTTCTTRAGDKLNFRWLKNGQEINASDRIQLRSYADVSTIIIDPLHEDDSGNYTCVVTSGIASDSFTTSLTVLVPPKWLHIPADKNVFEGSTITIDCLASGNPPPITTWMKALGLNDENFVKIHASSKSTIFGNGSLTLTEIEKADEGIYSCEISNGINQELKKTITIRVTAFYRKFNVRGR